MKTNGRLARVHSCFTTPSLLLQTYLDVTWRREWIEPAVDNVRAWWSKEYADLEVEECLEDKPIVEPSFFEKQKALIKLRQRIGNEFDAFI